MIYENRDDYHLWMDQVNQWLAEQGYPDAMAFPYDYEGAHRVGYSPAAVAADAMIENDPMFGGAAYPDNSTVWG